VLTEDREAKDPKGMTEQILAIAPILPGQKGKPGFDIPPHAPNPPTLNNSNRQQNAKAEPPPSGDGNDLIDFGEPGSNEKAVIANKSIPSQNRNRSISLMDDDHHIYAMNDKMGHMKLMDPTNTPKLPPVDNQKPLERTDTQTSEVDTFFDAQG
jgi:hypothetical protein